ncbi:MAG: phage tail protein [Myxococcota bacterium]|jgi:phage protein U|nr:phage tail protein [Myxococcota bacterium]
MLATLGSIVFEASADLVRTFGDAALKSSARWEAHEVIGRKPVQEYLGPALRTLGFAIRLDARLGVDPEAEAAALRDSVEQGEVLAFVLGGRPVGDWFIKELSETWRHVMADGRVQVIVVELSLEEYV